jgi:uncharacterized protein
MKDLVIPFSGMKEGDYSFSAELDKTFFEALEFSEIEKGNIKVEIEMQRRQHLLNFEITINGNVELECDRCGNTYDQEIEDHRHVVVNLNSDHFEDEDDLISIPQSQNDFDFTPYIYQYIVLAIPAKRVCPENVGCDPDVIQKLDQLHPGEKPADDDNTTDPRWDALRNLKDN